MFRNPVDDEAFLTGVFEGVLKRQNQDAGNDNSLLRAFASESLTEEANPIPALADGPS